MKVKIAGSWRSVTDIWVKVSGGWRKVTGGWAKVGGVWKRVLSTVIQKGVLAGDLSYYSVLPGYIEIHAEDSTDGNGAISTAVTNKAYDLTGVSYVKVECELTRSSNSSYADCIIIASTNKWADGSTYDARWFTSVAFSRQIKQLSVGSLSGQFYIRVHATKNPGVSNAYWTTVKIYRIWLDNTLIWQRE